MQAKLLQRLKKARQIQIYTHSDPDGDALGSAGLLRELIHKLNPRARVNILLDPQHKNELNAFLKKFSNPALTKPDLRISVDASDPRRLHGAAGQTIDINLDHHTGNANFADLNLVEPLAASCTLVIYSLLPQAGVKLTPAMAEWLYLGLCSDTGNFAFANTDERTFAAALDCVRAGVRPNSMYNKLNEQLAHREIVDFAKALSRAEGHCQGRLILAAVPARLKVDNRQLIDFIRRAKTAQVAAVLVEKKDHIKLSFRSKTGLDVAAIARRFNGGGHKKAAAGKIFNASLAEAKKLVVSYFRKNVWK